MNQEDQARQAFQEGNRLFGEGKYEEAIQAYNRSLELRPDDPDTLNNRGITYARMARYQEALADYNRSLELRPDYPDTLNNRGITYGSLGRYQEALADYNRSLELLPDDPDTLNNRGTTYDLMGRYQEALANYNRSLELRPDHPDTRYNRGITYGRMERYQEELADYNRSLELRPDSPNALNNRGVTYVRIGRYQEALADYNRSLEIRPDSPNTLIGRGVARIRSGQAEAALADLSRATRLASGELLVLAHFNLAAALLKLDTRAEARDALERVVKLDPGFHGAQEALQQLRTPERGNWWTFWLSRGVSRPRRVFGAALIALLLVYVVYPLMPPGTYIPVPWGDGRFLLNTGQGWQFYLVPVAVLAGLLVLPVVAVRVRVGPVDLEPRPPEPQATPELEPRLSR